MKVKDFIQVGFVTDVTIVIFSTVAGARQIVISRKKDFLVMIVV